MTMKKRLNQTEVDEMKQEVEKSDAYRNRVNDTLKADTHYPCSRPVNTRVVCIGLKKMRVVDIGDNRC